MYFLQAVITIWQREIIRYFRDKSRIFANFFQPLMFLFIFGVGLQKTMAQGNFGIDFIQFMYPGIIAMSVMGVSFFSTVSTVWDREFGFLKEILVAPVSRTSIAVGKALGAATIASMQGLIFLVLAPLVGIHLSWLAVPALFGLIVILSFAISGVGLLVASLMTSTESFGLVMQLVVFPMFFLSGAFFPLTAVPLWMTVLSRIIPLSYGVDAFRQVILGGQVPEAIIKSITLYPIHLDVLFLAAFSSVMITAAVFAFNKKA